MIFEANEVTTAYAKSTIQATAVAAAVIVNNCIFLLSFINFTILRTDMSNSRNKPAGLDF